MFFLAIQETPTTQPFRLNRYNRHALRQESLLNAHQRRQLLSAHPIAMPSRMIATMPSGETKNRGPRLSHFIDGSSLPNFFDIQFDKKFLFAFSNTHPFDIKHRVEWLLHHYPKTNVNYWQAKALIDIIIARVVPYAAPQDLPSLEWIGTHLRHLTTRADNPELQKGACLASIALSSYYFYKLYSTLCRCQKISNQEGYILQLFQETRNFLHILTGYDGRFKITDSVDAPELSTSDHWRTVDVNRAFYRKAILSYDAMIRTIIHKAQRLLNPHAFQLHPANAYLRFRWPAIEKQMFCRFYQDAQRQIANF